MGLVTAAAVVQSTGLSPLILATTGFLISAQAKFTSLLPSDIAQLIPQSHSGQGANLVSDHWPISKVVHIVTIAGVALGIIAGEDATKPQDANLVSAFRKISALLFFAVFLFLTGLDGYFWVNRRALLPSRRTVSIIFPVCSSMTNFNLHSFLSQFLPLFSGSSYDSSTLSAERSSPQQQ